MSALDSLPPNNKQNRPLSEEEAHEEANMLKAKIELDPRYGKVPTTKLEKIAMLPDEGREPTAEDYDAALAAVEELRELATQEVPSEKIRDFFGRLSANSAIAGWIFMRAIMGIWDMEKDRLGIENFDDSTDRTDRFAFSKIDEAEAWKTRFENASYQLRKLKREAKKYS